MKYRFEKVEDPQKWDEFVKSSPQGTVFSLWDYMVNCGINFNLFFVKKGNEIKAGLSFLTNETNEKIILDDLVIYNGIMFIENKNKKETRSKTERFEISEMIIEFLVKRFNSIMFRLSPNFEDIRPFLWYNYHLDDPLKKFKVNVRYTSYLDIHDLFYKKEEVYDSVYLNLDNRRQSDIKKARNNNLIFVKDEIPVDRFIQYYVNTVYKDSALANLQYLKRMSGLIENGLQKKILRIYGVKRSGDELAYIVIFGLLNEVATYIFGSGNKDIMERYDATYCLWMAMKDLNHNYGVSLIDLEGVNSPKRGAFKLSFGGDLRTYYEVSL